MMRFILFSVQSRDSQREVSMTTTIRACLLWSAIFFAALAPSVHAAEGGGTPVDASLSEEALKAVTRSVLEVVVPKPEQDSLQYERPLPMDLLPYAFRTDKYYST